MSEETDPRTPRESRKAESREATSRKKQWVNPKSLNDPDPREGIAHRWVRAEILGQSDKANMASRLREGWEIAPPSEYPELKDFVTDDGALIERGGLILCRTDKEVMDQRTEHYRKLASSQMQSVDQSYFREQDPRMPMLDPERRTRSRFGKGAERE